MTDQAGPELEVAPDEPADPLSQVSEDVRRQWDYTGLWDPCPLAYHGRP